MLGLIIWPVWLGFSTYIRTGHNSSPTYIESRAWKINGRLNQIVSAGFFICLFVFLGPFIDWSSNEGNYSVITHKHSIQLVSFIQPFNLHICSWSGPHNGLVELAYLRDCIIILRDFHFPDIVFFFFFSSQFFILSGVIVSTHETTEPRARRPHTWDLIIRSFDVFFPF